MFNLSDAAHALLVVKWGLSHDYYALCTQALGSACFSQMSRTCGASLRCNNHPEALPWSQEPGQDHIQAL